MKKIKMTLAMLALVLASTAYTSSAQIYVKVRPERPHTERPERPSPRHVWIDEDWHAEGNNYTFSGGRWAEPPHPHARWVPGHWKETPQGQVWREGHWRQ